MDLQKIRYLDIDDLIIMTIALENGLVTLKIAGKLVLTPPAISHRLNKYARIFGPDIYAAKLVKAKKARKELSEKGRKIFRTCAKAFKILNSD